MDNKTENIEQMYLVTWKGNWAGEISFIGRSVMSESQVKQFEKDLKGNRNYFTLYYGSNQDSDMSYNDYYASCSFKKIPPDAVKFVKEIFYGDWSHWNPDQVWEWLKEEAENADDEDDESRL